MALQETGVELVAKGAASFVQQLNSADKATKNFGEGSKSSAKGINFLTVAIGNLVASGIQRLISLFGDATRAATGFMVDSISMAADLEVQMDAIGAIMSLTGDEVEMLGGLISELGLDPNLKVTSLEAAEAIEMLGRNGLNLDQIMEGAAKATVLLSNATGADFSTSANVATDAMALFKIEAEDMGQVVNGMVGVVNNSKFTVDDYSLALRNGGAAAGDMGVSLQDFNVMVAASAEELGTGMRAGTGFTNFINRLTPNTKKATEMMRDLGLITAEGTNQFFNSEGQLKSLNEVSVLLNESLGGLTDQQRSMNVETIFGRDAMGTVLALMNEGNVVYTDLATASKELGIEQSILNEYIDGGITSFEILSAQMDMVDSEGAAAQRVDNFRGSLDIALGVIEEIQLQIGKNFLPILKELADKFAELASENSEKIVEFFTRLTEKIGAFVLAVTEAFLGGDSPFNAMMKGLKEAKVSEDVIQSIEDIASSVMNIGNFLRTNGPNILKTLGAMFAAFQAFKILSTITSLISGAIAVWGTLSATIATSGTVLGGIVAFLGGPVTIAIAAITAIVAGLYLAWQTNFLGIRDIVADVMPTVRGFISEAMTTIQGIVSSVLAVILSWWKSHGDSVMTIINGMVSVVVSVFNVLASRVTSVVQTLVSGVMFAWTHFGQVWKTLTTGFVNGLSIIFDTFGTMISAIIDGIAAAISGDWTTFGQKMREATDAFILGIVLLFTNAIATLVGVVNEIISGIKSAWGSFDWSSLGTAVADGLSGGIKAGIGKVIEAAKSMAQAAKDAVTGFMGIQSPSRLFAWIAEMVVAGFVNKLNDSESLIKDTFEKVFSFAGQMSSISSSAINIFKRDLLGGLEKEIEDGGGKVKEALIKANNLIREGTLGEDGLKEYNEKIAYLKEIEDHIAGLENGTIGMSLSQAELDQELKNARKVYSAAYEEFATGYKVENSQALLDMMSRPEQTDLMYQALRDGNNELAEAIQNVWKEQEKVNEVTREYEEQQQKILDIETKKQNIDLMKQQIDLIKFAQENGLDTSNLFGPNGAGFQATPEGILDATLTAFDKVLGSLSSVLPPARPDSRSSVTNNNNSMTTEVNVSGTFQGESLPTVASSIERVLAGV